MKLVVELNENHISCHPEIKKEFEIKGKEMQIGTAWGGPIYLRVPVGKSGQTDIQVKGALPMAVYTGGNNGSGNGSVEEFKDALEKGAPMAILKEKGGKFNCIIKLQPPKWGTNNSRHGK